MASRCLLKAFEELDAWLLQKGLRMNSTLNVREKWTLKVDAAWLCLQRLRLGLDCIRERFKRA